MNWDERFREGEQRISEGRVAEAIDHYKSIMEEAGEDKKVYYWALKHLGDVVGYAGLKDYMQAIDIYQKIINEYEGDDDTLYNWCQIDIARSYLEMGMEMLENFDNMMDILELEDEKMMKYIDKLVQKRNDYIEKEAEILYKQRM